MSENYVQIIDNNYLRPKRDGKYFPTLDKEVLEHDLHSNSSWYNLSDEAYNEWLLCLELCSQLNNKAKITNNEIQVSVATLLAWKNYHEQNDGKCALDKNGTDLFCEYGCWSVDTMCKTINTVIGVLKAEEIVSSDADELAKLVTYKPKFKIEDVDYSNYDDEYDDI